MSYFAAFDGGGTKTRCIICDEKGNVFADTKAGASNYQTVGIEASKAAIEEAFSNALQASEIKPEQISSAFLGLSGADEEYDLEIINKLCDLVFKGITFKVVNDSWICLRSGLKQKWGVVSICGTGFNSGGRNPDGKEVILRAAGYELGNFGGGDQLARMALHHVFRADEGTGDKTLLQTMIPMILKEKSMTELYHKFRQSEEYFEECLDKIPPLVFRLAMQRDKVCQEILIRMGQIIGEEISGVILRLGMEDMKVPVVLGGSLYSAYETCPLLNDQLITALHKTAPQAYLTHPALPPVAGAYLSALDEAGINVSEPVYQNLQNRLDCGSIAI